MLFFDDMTSIKNFDPNKIKIVEKLYEKSFMGLNT